eukprot:7461130-Lingulodinium_polyedra.AAC.1
MARMTTNELASNDFCKTEIKKKPAVASGSKGVLAIVDSAASERASATATKKRAKVMKKPAPEDSQDGRALNE